MSDARDVIGNAVGMFCDHIGEVQERPGDDLGCDECRKIRDAILSALYIAGLVVVSQSDMEALPMAAHDAAFSTIVSLPAAERAYLHLKSKVAAMCDPAPPKEK